MHLQNVISLAEEMHSYETLYGARSITQRTLSKLFQRYDVLPSQLLKILQSESLFGDLQELYKKVGDFLSGLRGFCVSVHRAFQYPLKLRAAKYPVELLYYRGNIGLIDSRCISIVGARQASEAGLKRAAQLSRMLVEADFTIVSGLAAGVDTVAMREAMAANGRTIGVIGTPITETYPKENKELQETVARGHLLISQVPFYRYKHEHYLSHKVYFPQRNVTMAALAEATIIVEASDTSGSLTQARACLQQGKKLFILNSCFEDKRISWPEKYQQKGAIRVRQIDDILVALSTDEHGGINVEKA